MLNPKQKAQKKWYAENKEIQKLKQKEYRNQNKEYIKNRHKEYYEKNKEDQKEKARLYRLNNPEKISNQKKVYYSSEKGIKVNRICGWKNIGVICDYETIYDIYINTQKCDFCQKDFKSNQDRNLDHNHSTGEVRGILCMSCNVKDVFKGN